MVAGGIDRRRSVDYAEAIANMALEMRDRVERVSRAPATGSRSASASTPGPVVAGVIGKKKFIYDLWGDTVNVATRMAADAFPARCRSTSPPTGACTRVRVRRADDVYLKGKGRMQVHHLLERI